MATGQQWREHFEKKNKSYLRKQLKLIENAKRLDDKIFDEFQLNYLSVVSSIIHDILRSKR